MTADALGGQVAVVTGAGGGVGRLIALQLAAEGAAVVCAPGDGTADEIRALGGRAASSDADLSEMDGGERVAGLARERFGRLDILVNAAAGLDAADDPAWGAGVADLSPEDFYAAVRTRLRATFAPTRHAAAVFRAQRSGRIVSITSDDGLGAPGAAARAMVSEGIVGLTRTVGRDLGKYGVTVNAVVADDPEAGTVLAATLCTGAVPNLNGRTLGASDGAVFLYAEPEIVAGVHGWGGLGLDELERLVPRVIGPALGAEGR